MQGASPPLRVKVVGLAFGAVMVLAVLSWAARQSLLTMLVLGTVVVLPQGKGRSLGRPRPFLSSGSPSYRFRGRWR